MNKGYNKPPDKINRPAEPPPPPPQFLHGRDININIKFESDSNIPKLKPKEEFYEESGELAEYIGVVADGKITKSAIVTNPNYIKWLERKYLQYKAVIRELKGRVQL